MKRIIMILVLGMIFMLCGCSADSSQENEVIEKGFTYEIENYTDPETGVCYLIYDGGYDGGITVRYNSDGSIMVKNQ